MAFDPQAKLVAANAHSVADLEAQFGDVGSVNGSRNKPNKRSTTSNEAYLVRRLVLHLAKSGQLSFPISVDHRDRPDFCIEHGTGKILLEVTEACPASEGAKFASETEGVHLIGESRGGLEEDQADLLAQIQDSIDRKRCKKYAVEGEISLLIYPNSEASQWVGFFEKNPKELFSKLDTSFLKTLYVFWGAEFIEVNGMRK